MSKYTYEETGTTINEELYESDGTNRSITHIPAESRLTEKQQLAIKYMEKGGNVFLTGPAGTGKTYLLNVFIKWYETFKYEEDVNEIHVTSTTGLSSLLINGITINRFAGIGYADKDVDYYVKQIVKKRPLYKRWVATGALIIDEISMMSPDTFDLLNIVAQKVRSNRKPFGGIQLILSGDFFQLPPVKSPDFCFEAISWDSVITKTFYFNEVLRQTNVTFQRVLNNLRVGVCTDEDREVLNTCINRNFVNDFGIEPTLLFSKKNMVNDYNKLELQKLLDAGNESYTYTATYKYINTTLSEATKEFLKNVVDVSYPTAENELTLVIGSQVMLTVNKPDNNLANGSRGIIIGFKKNMPKVPLVRFLDGQELEISLFEWKTEEGGHIVSKIQIPLILAWAITIHKAQGMTLEYVVTDIGDSIFEYGQTYVVLSRVKTLEGLGLLKIDYSKIRANPKILRYYNALLDDCDEAGYKYHTGPPILK